jgi:hypothetical protein
MAFDDEDGARRGAELHLLIMSTAQAIDVLLKQRADVSGFVPRSTEEVRAHHQLRLAMKPFCGPVDRRTEDTALLAQLPRTPDHSHDNGELPRPVETTDAR